ncbi:MAG: VCBS repeat-containing protein [Bacteroidia bacterium]
MAPHTRWGIRQTLLLLQCCLGSIVHAQGLLGSNPALPQIHAGALAWADYDSDGDGDLLMAGEDSAGVAVVQLLRNDGPNFVPMPVPFSPMPAAACAWGDSDGDGDPDLLLTGRKRGKGRTEHWVNNGPAGFALHSPGLPGVQHGAVAYGDLDGDGDLDAIIAGANYDRGYISLVLENNGGVLREAGTGIEGFCTAQLATADLDGDSLPEVILCGRVQGGEPAFAAYHNLGGFQFTQLSGNVPAMPEGSLSLADFDLDGDPDLLASGASRPYGLGIWTTDGGTFSGTANLGLPGIALGDAQCLDFNGDGLQDFVYCGTEVGGGAVARAMRQLPGGGFSDHQPSHPLAGLHLCRIAVADWNGDGHPDFALSGVDGAGLGVAVLYRWDVPAGRFVR